MAHINDIYASDLYHILCLVLGEPAKHIDEWKKQLPLLQVCRQWYDMLRSYVFSPGFVIIDDLHVPDSSKDNIKSCVYYAGNGFVCRTNLGIITGRDEYNCNCVTSLDVGVSTQSYLEQSDSILKRLLSLGVGYWLSLTSLSLRIYDNDIYDSPVDSGLGTKDIALAVSKTVLDFKSKVPNLIRLYIEGTGYYDVLSLALPIFINKYAHKLQHLDCRSPLEQPPSSFSGELTFLSLNLDDTTTRLASVYAGSLKHLYLYDIPNAFSWWSFHDDLTPGYIEFTNLETLGLMYSGQKEVERKLSIKYSKQNRPYGCHMLQFPKVSSLRFANCPADCDVLFTDTIPSHIKRLHISSGSNSMAAVSKLRFSTIDELYILLAGGELLSDEFCNAADYYFGTAKVCGDCKLDIRATNNVKLRQTRTWVNLTSLTLMAIELNELLGIIPDLYNLQYLRIYLINLDGDSISTIRHGLDEENQPTIERLGTKISEIFIHGVSPYTPYKVPHSFLHCANYLIMRISTLKIFATSDNHYYSVVNGFLFDKFKRLLFKLDHFPSEKVGVWGLPSWINPESHRFL